MRIASLLLVCCFAPIQAEANAIYRCEVAGVASYSDRPCGVDAQLHKLNEAVTSTYTAPPNTQAPKLQSKPLKKRAKPSATQPEELAKRALLCDRLTSSIKEVRSKMRAGYTAKEGERLRERLAKLKAQTNAAKCR